MISKKMILLIATLQLFFSTVSGMQNQGGSEKVVNTLDLGPCKGLQQKILPFEYKHLSEDERARVTWLPERFYTIIEPGSEKLVLVGPLQPCLFVAIKNNDNGRVIIFHKHSSNKIEYLVQIACEKLGIMNPRAIRGVVFTNIPNNPFVAAALRSELQGRSIEEEVSFVKDRLISLFQIPSSEANQIESFCFNSYPAYELGEYEFAELSVIIGENFKPYSISMIHENIFDEMVPFSSAPLSKKVKKFEEILVSKVYEITRKNFGEIMEDSVYGGEDLLYYYDQLPFACI